MKKILIALLSVMSIIGLISILGVFSSSLNPSEKARSERSQYNISNLETGSFLLVNFKRENAWNDKVLIIRDWSGEIFVHLIPSENDAVSLPDRYWGWAIASCNNFGPETELNGKIIQSGKIKCHDKKEPKWLSFTRWEWSYSGKSLVEWTPDLYSPKYEIKDGTLFINR